ncbi:NUDIX hydrolase 19, chloroplastic-like protein [Tanacetum coccineum]
MSINLKSPVFAGNPIKSKTPKPTDPFSHTQAFETLKNLISNKTHDQDSSLTIKILPLSKGKPLAGSTGEKWHLGWFSFDEFKDVLVGFEVNLSEDMFVYLGYENGVVYWGTDMSLLGESLVREFGAKQLCFVQLTTLMVATDWSDEDAMGQLAIAGHARAILEWHITSRFCGSCGEKLIPIEAGRRKQCTNESCKKKIYPRIDPVVIMLVIDKENDRALFSKMGRFVPRMWTCLSGFLEPGESLEEAVRRETMEETGIEVGEVVYHSSQPWPAGPSSMPCQLMVGFLAYALSFEITVDKKELEDFSVESGELVPMFVPGPFAIAHHLISSWAHQMCYAKKSTIVISRSFKNKAIGKVYYIVKLVDSQSFKSQANTMVILGGTVISWKPVVIRMP